MNPQAAAQDAKLRFIIFPVKTLTVLLFTLAMCVHAADKVMIRINGVNVSAYRTADLENAKKDAKAANKPIVWIAADPQSLTGPGIIAEESSNGATWHAFYSMRDKAILVFEDAYAENHQVLDFIDQALGGGIGFGGDASAFIEQQAHVRAKPQRRVGDQQLAGDMDDQNRVGSGLARRINLRLRAFHRSGGNIERADGFLGVGDEWRFRRREKMFRRETAAGDQQRSADASPSAKVFGRNHFWFDWCLSFGVLPLHSSSTPESSQVFPWSLLAWKNR